MKPLGPMGPCRGTMLAVAIWTALPTAVNMAQGARLPDADSAALKKPVRLAMGATTAGELAAELSRQTGPAVVASASIRERKVVVEVEGGTAAQALDAIAELYDWRWYRDEPGHYVVDRKVFRRPKDLAVIPALTQAALPVDIRDYLQLPDLASKRPEERTSMTASTMPYNHAVEARERLKAALLDLFLRKDTVRVSALSREQQFDLALWLVFDQVRYSLELLHDDMAAHRMDPQKVVLSIHNNGSDLMVDTAPGVSPDFGFGTQIVPP